MKKIFAVLLLLSLLLFSSCKKSKYSVNYDFEFLSSPVSIVVSGEISDKEKSEIKTLLDSLENELSVEKEGSTLSRFNLNDKNVPIEFDFNTKYLLTLSNKLYDLSDGRFNPAVLPLSELFSFTLNTFGKGDFVLPNNISVEETLKKCNFKGVNLETGEKTDKDIKMDLSAVAKGYAVDKIKDILGDRESGYIAIGKSSIYVYDAESFYVTHPRQSEKNEYIFSFNKEFVKGNSVATSGDYEKFYVFDGERYCHIIDGVTGYPIKTGAVSVTVVGDNGAVADGLSTFFSFYSSSEIESEIKEILKIEECKNYAFFVVYEKGDLKLVYTNASEQDFILKDNSYSIIKVI